MTLKSFYIALFGMFCLSISAASADGFLRILMDPKFEGKNRQINFAATNFTAATNLQAKIKSEAGTNLTKSSNIVVTPNVQSKSKEFR